jgi:UDP-3-O-[3-hydroxymyristoyl] N-acetylglucosamine deacetylase
VVDRIGFSGAGLHSGEPCSVTLLRLPGPFRLGPAGRQYTRDDLRLLRADSGVSVGSNDGFAVDLIEHLFAACAGLGVQRDVAVIVEGPEIPLLDGGAEDLGRSLMALGIESCAPGLVIARAGVVEVGESRYRFEPAPLSTVTVRVEFAPLGSQTAHWDGSRAGFLAEIAPARTFGFRSQATDLRSRGRAAFVNPRSVIVLEDDGTVLEPGTPPRPGELARHKLLDLLGDLYLYGGPPRGHVDATRPVHLSNHKALLEGLGLGLLERIVEPSARDAGNACGGRLA